MKVERKEVVLDMRELPREKRGKIGGQYPHSVEDKIYFQLEEPKQIGYAIWDGKQYNKPKDNVVITNSLAAHNWRVFVDDNPNTPPEERYKAVGGYHVGRGSIAITPAAAGKFKQDLYATLVDCPISKDLEVVKVIDPVWPESAKLIFKDDFYHPRHANGLYVFVSSDGINWKEYHDRPVFSILTECEDLPIGVLGLDWMPSIFFDHNINEYVIYLRANIALGCRNIMYSRSKDLINWTKPSLIKCNPEFDAKNKQNFYFSGVYPMGDNYVAFPPHFTNKIHDADGHHRTYENEYTPVMISSDGVNWEIKTKILESNTGQHLYQPHVCTFKEHDDECVLYVHEGFQTANGKLVKYLIHKDDLIGLMQ
tara:strand:+ start:1481 stop:2581 length:1101 start_codon:yes stop_codon:yes gene_type:complete